ncbi:MAG: hypothetical protein WC180_06590 [Candidatus Paceibacterota bacterium]
MDYSSSEEQFESIRKIKYTEYKLIVFRGIISKLQITGTYFKFETKKGKTLVFDVGYIHYGTIYFNKSTPCEIIYLGGIIRVTNLE